MRVHCLAHGQHTTEEQAMPLQDVTLDDLRFRAVLTRRANALCAIVPKWTDYNLSDPGITLIELFAWMTEMISCTRLNRVPEKNYVRFLDLLGVQLLPARSRVQG